MRYFREKPRWASVQATARILQGQSEQDWVNIATETHETIQDFRDLLQLMQGRSIKKFALRISTIKYDALDISCQFEAFKTLDLETIAIEDYSCFSREIFVGQLVRQILKSPNYRELSFFNFNFNQGTNYILLQGSWPETLESLSILDCNISDDGFATWLQSLKSTAIKRLILARCVLNRVAIQALSELINNCPQLEYLDISSSFISSAQLYGILNLAGFKKIKHLYCDFLTFDSAVEKKLLSLLETGQLLSLSVRDSQISSQFIENIFIMLGKNIPLSYLQFTSSYVSSELIQTMFIQLLKNTNLRTCLSEGLAYITCSVIVNAILAGNTAIEACSVSESLEYHIEVCYLQKMLEYNRCLNQCLPDSPEFKQLARKSYQFREKLVCDHPELKIYLQKSDLRRYAYYVPSLQEYVSRVLADLYQTQPEHEVFQETDIWLLEPIVNLLPLSSAYKQVLQQNSIKFSYETKNSNSVKSIDHLQLT